MALPVGPGTGVSGPWAPGGGPWGPAVGKPDGVGRGATVKVGFTTGVAGVVGTAEGAAGGGVRGPLVGSGAGVGLVGSGAGGTRGSGKAGSVAAAKIWVFFQLGPKGPPAVASGLGVTMVLGTPLLPRPVTPTNTRSAIRLPIATAATKTSAPKSKTTVKNRRSRIGEIDVRIGHCSGSFAVVGGSDQL